jgi:hypothetical protein
MKIVNDDVLRELHTQELTVPQMSEVTGWSKCSIYSGLKRLGLRRHSAAIGKPSNRRGKKGPQKCKFESFQSWADGWYKIARGEWSRSRTNFALANFAKYTIEAEKCRT